MLQLLTGGKVRRRVRHGDGRFLGLRLQGLVTVPILAGGGHMGHADDLLYGIMAAVRLTVGVERPLVGL